jgi:hypothetical protein
MRHYLWCTYEVRDHVLNAHMYAYAYVDMCADTKPLNPSMNAGIFVSTYKVHDIVWVCGYSCTHACISGISVCRPNVAPKKEKEMHTVSHATVYDKVCVLMCVCMYVCV